MHAGVVVSLVCASIAVAAPLLLAALGEIVVERSGVINVGIEGMMLVGAFAAFAAAHAAGSALAGAVAGCASGALLAALFALMAVRYRADQVVTGTALNILALGLTGVVTPSLSSLQHTPSFHPYSLRVPGGQPVTADALSILALILVPVIGIFLSKTRTGLRLRSAGEYPNAAADAGANVPRLATGAILFGGGMAGLAGACLSIAYTVGVAQGLTNGRGFIALAVVIVGRWSPAGALLASLLFGAASALQAWGQAIDLRLPYQFLLALPYLVTIAALVFRASRNLSPASLGVPYEAE
ncbi:MAG: ABC transporter permease [Capsulimonadaceae bacterium]|nr:ABC transporter permease [Capsulimonadaceae bacterium]